MCEKNSPKAIDISNVKLSKSSSKKKKNLVSKKHNTISAEIISTFTEMQKSKSMYVAFVREKL